MSVRRRNGKRSDQPADMLGYCPECGKQTFRSRKAARRAAKTCLPHERLSAYPCPVNDNHFHFGHLSDAVRAGRFSRSDYYRKGLGEVGHE